MSSPSDEAKQAVIRIPRVAAGMGFDAEGRPKTNDLVMGRRTSTPSGDRGVLAQVLRENLWVTNNTVTAAAFSNNALYLGGLFTQVGPATGGFAAVDLDSGAALQPYPLVVGEVRAVASDGSGGWYIGGIFTSVRGQPRNNLAHLDASGNLTAWDPNANDEIRALVVSGSTVYAGGRFTGIGGQPRNHIAALDATTGMATNWDPNANDAVYALLVGVGTVYVGGRFTSIGGQPRNHLAALDATTGMATSWNADTDHSVVALASSGNTIYAGGAFTSIGGQTRNSLAALDATTGAVLSFNPNTDSFVLALAVTTLSHFPFTVTVYAGGDFTNIGGQTRNHLAALDGMTGAATSWNPNADNQVFALAVRGSGPFLDPVTVYAGGHFTNIGGQTRTYLAALDVTDGAATSWNPHAGDAVFSITVSGGAVYAGGYFGSIGGQTRNHIAAFDATTGLPTSWDPNANDAVFSLAVSGNTVYAGGDFTNIGGQTRNHLAALDGTTGAATSWNPNANALVDALTVSGNTVYAGGFFTIMGGQHRSRMAALDASTGALLSFNPNADSFVSALAVTTLSHFPFTVTVYAGGAFTNIGGQTRNHLAALDGTTGAATSWNPNANSYVYALAVRGSGLFQNPVTVYAGGGFTSIGGQPRNHLAALDVASGAATSFNPNPNGVTFPFPGVYALLVNGNTVYAGGGFTSIGGQPRNSLAALDGTTGAAMSWDPNANSVVYSFAQDGGTVYAGGAFTSVLGETRWGIVGLSGVPTALEEPSGAGAHEH